jgi:hypothetical protein
VYRFQINFVVISFVFLGEIESVNQRKGWKKYNSGGLKVGRNFCETKNFVPD